MNILTQHNSNISRIDRPVNYYFLFDLAFAHILSFIYISFFLYSDKYLRHIDIPYMNILLSLVHIIFIYYLCKLVLICSKEWFLQRNAGFKSVNDIIARKQLKANMPACFFTSILVSVVFYYYNSIKTNSSDLGVLTKGIDTSICQSITIFVLILCYGFLISKLKKPGVQYNEFNLTPIEQHQQKNIKIFASYKNDIYDEIFTLFFLLALTIPFIADPVTVNKYPIKFVYVVNLYCLTTFILMLLTVINIFKYFFLGRQT